MNSEALTENGISVEMVQETLYWMLGMPIIHVPDIASVPMMARIVDRPGFDRTT